MAARMMRRASSSGMRNLFGSDLSTLTGLPSGPGLLFGNDREGVGHQHAHGAVAEPALLLRLGRRGGLGALAKLLGDGPARRLLGGCERRRRQQRQEPRRPRRRPTETTPFASTAPLLPRRKLASFAAIAIGETGRNYDTFFAAARRAARESEATIPRQVRTSCSVAPMRWNMLRMARTIEGRFSGG